MSWTVSISSGPPIVGEWEIEPGPPANASLADFYRQAREALPDFLAAFRDLVQIEEVLVDLMWLDEGGHVARVEEAERISVDAEGRLGVPADVDLITSIIARCALRVDDGSAITWQHEALQFQYTCVVDFDDDDRASPAESGFYVSVSVDCWSDPRGATNVAKLSRSLKEWEQRVGAPIVVWSSHANHPNIGRYGFDNAVTT